MELHIVTFDPVAWFNIEPVRSTAGALGRRNFWAIARQYAEIPNSWAYSLVATEGLVASGGFMPILPGVAEIWCATTALTREPWAGAAVAVKMRGMVVHGMEAFNLRRVQATIAREDADTRRLVEALGLVEETQPDGLRGFLPDGGAVCIYGRTR